MRIIGVKNSDILHGACSSVKWNALFDFSIFDLTQVPVRILTQTNCQYMEMHAHILLLLLSLIAHVHQCNTSDLTHKTILDIDDYQFHFSTFHYEFPILQPVSAVIEHPFDDH
eukprot:1156387_1